MKDVHVIIGLAFLLSIGFLLNILACAIYGSWWPFFVVVAYFLAPLPNICCQNLGTGYQDSKEKAFRNAGYFLTGAIVVTGFALPAVLTHARVIKHAEALILGVSGGLVVYTTILVYLHKFHGKRWDSFENY
eukprot:TRINITY_DN305_c0_g1_i1.p1 TRINITY_DN305_c0_g1~~TRINITY_DN305_c0_g1_i1.p1  ORF type:complete len:132 (-),score=20.81 TRINITY_DN305_c0_g1_i1:43-438(-)